MPQWVVSSPCFYVSGVSGPAFLWTGSTHLLWVPVWRRHRRRALYAFFELGTVLGKPPPKSRQEWSRV